MPAFDHSSAAAATPAAGVARVLAGEHHCLGASLAKLEIGLIFNAIADAMPDIRPAGAPERLRSGWLNGIKLFPVPYR